MLPFDIVAAVDLDSGIGKEGGLPWKLSADLKHFKDVTTRTHAPDKKNAVIMGRKTWESLPEKSRPLPGRINVVLTHHKEFVLPSDVLRAENLDSALLVLSSTKVKENVETVFVIGGAQVFREAIGHPRCRKVYLTRIFGQFGCDVFFPPLPQHCEQVSQSPHFFENSLEYNFTEYLCRA